MFEELENFKRLLEEKEKKREELIKKCRELRILSTKAINAVHKGKMEKAADFLNKAKKMLNEIYEYRNSYPEFYFTLTHNSMQEYAEAYAFFSLINDKRIEINEIKVEVPALLCGLADFVGELRRYVLDLLRKEKIDEAEKYTEVIEQVYHELVQFDFPERMLPGFRHKLDMVRAVMEKTKADLLTTKAALKLKFSSLKYRKMSGNNL